MFKAAIGVTTSYDTLLDLFECVANFLNRINIYTDRIPLSPTMSDILVKIMAQVLAVLALATKQVKQGRLSKWPTDYRPFPSSAERLAAFYREIHEEVTRRGRS